MPFYASNPSIPQTRAQTGNVGTTGFLNRMREHGISDEEAKNIVERARHYVIQGEENSQRRLEMGQRGRDLAQGKIWNEEDEAFFADLNLSQYTVNIHRTLLNQLYEQQQNEKLTFHIEPKDKQAKRRYDEARQQYAQAKAEEFGSFEAAAEYFDENVDDEYGRMLSALLLDTRDNCNARDEENEVYRGGVETGIHFFKAQWSDKYDRMGGIDVQHVPQNAMIWDEPRSTRFEMDDIRFIGEKKEVYPEDLFELYPDSYDELQRIFQQFMYHRNYALGTNIVPQRWRNFFNWERGNTHGTNQNNIKIKVTELWTLHTEPRLRVHDAETNEIFIAKPDVDAQTIFDQLITQLTQQEFERRLSDPNVDGDQLAAEFGDAGEVRQRMTDLVFERFTIEEVQEKVWWKTVFTYNALLECVRSPYPHQGHPYQAFFAQFNEGDARGVMEDVHDVIIAYQKAIAFRELILAHGAKQFLMVDKKTLEDNDISKEDLADKWTEIGGVVALRLDEQTRMQDVAMPVSTVGGDGLSQYVEQMIANYERMIADIIGVTPEQIGKAGSEVPAARYQQQLRQSRGNNGVIYRNYMRAMRLFYKKVMMMEVELLKWRKRRVVRLMGEDYQLWAGAPFLEVQWNDEFEIFEESIKNGQFGLTLVPEQDTPQLQAAREAMMMEMATNMPQQMPLEVALKYSSHPQRHRILKDIRQWKNMQAMQQAQQQLDLETAQQIMLEEGNLSAEEVDRLVRRMQLQTERNIKQQQQQQEQRQGGQRSQMMSKLARGGVEDQRVQERVSRNAEGEPAGGPGS